MPFKSILSRCFLTTLSCYLLNLSLSSIFRQLNKMQLFVKKLKIHFAVIINVDLGSLKKMNQEPIFLVRCCLCFFLFFLQLYDSLTPFPRISSLLTHLENCSAVKVILESAVDLHYVLCRRYIVQICTVKIW